MARVKRSVAAREKHKKIYKQTRGFRHGRKKLIKVARQAAIRAGQNAYVGRKQKKRNFRSLWIVRVNAACKSNGIRYSEFINKLKTKNITLNRKVLSELAAQNPEEFKKIVEKVKQ